ncbi:MAG: serine/threonine-protein kinase [Actinomycetota bacterium]
MTAERLPALDRYRVDEVIGTGGFSTVYRAMDERFDTPVAIKVLADNHAVSVEVRERFIAEAQLLRRLAGVPTVAVYDLGETPSGQPYAVMALADGDLGDRVARFQNGQQVIGWSDVSRVIDELARSLAALHEQGIVHRDVKPSNLLVFGSADVASPSPHPVPSPDGHGGPGHGGPAHGGQGLLRPSEALRLGDLGFAKDLRLRSGLTIGGGTPGFMPPEQGRPGVVDTRADIYAATALVVWLLCGRTPNQVKPDEVAGLLTQRLGPSRSVDGLEQGLANDPAKRPATIEEWRNLLHDTLGPPQVPGVGLDPAQPTVLVDPDTPLARPSHAAPAAAAATAAGSPRRRVGMALVAVAAVAGLAAGWLVGRSDGGADTAAAATVETTRLADDEVRHTATMDGVEVAVTGPDRVELGQTVTFVADASDAEALRWVGPDGSIIGGQTELSILASQLGEGELSLVATVGGSGQALVIPIPFTVVETAGS